MDYKNELKRHPSHQYLLKFIHQRKWADVKSIMRNDEVFIEISDFENNLPVHLCLKYGCPVDIINMINIAYPVCFSIRDPQVVMFQIRS